MYYSAIGLLAVLLLFFVNWDILYKPGPSYEKKAWKLYRRFLLAVLVYYVSDVLWGVLESSRLSAPLFADTTVYFAAMAAGVLFWAEFTVAYLEGDRSFGRALVLAGRILAGGIALLSLVNIFVPVLFTVDKDCVYRALPARYASLACQILLLLLIAAYSFFVHAPSGQCPREAPQIRDPDLLWADHGDVPLRAALVPAAAAVFHCVYAGDQPAPFLRGER